RDPEPVPLAAPQHELRQRPRDVCFECRVEAVFAGIEHAVKLDDGAQIARSQIVAKRKIHRCSPFHTDYSHSRMGYPRLEVFCSIPSVDSVESRRKESSMLHFILVLALRHGVDEKGFDAISLNMTKREVLTVLNRPPEPRPEVLRERPFPS